MILPPELRSMLASDMRAMHQQSLMLAAQQNAAQAYHQQFRNISLLNQYAGYRPQADTRPEWLLRAISAIEQLRVDLEGSGSTAALDWQLVRHDMPLLHEAYSQAPEANETKQAAIALREAAIRGSQRIKERKVAKGIAAAETLLSRVARVFR